MEYYQEAYDAECAAMARALAEAAEKAKRRKLGRVRIFTDAQPAIAGVTHDEPSPGPPAEEGDSSPAQAGAGCRNQDPLVPSTQRGSPGMRSRPVNRTTTESSGSHTPTSTSGGPCHQPPWRT